jgi:hypothetical protein
MVNSVHFFWFLCDDSRARFGLLIERHHDRVSGR